MIIGISLIGASARLLDGVSVLLRAVLYCILYMSGCFKNEGGKIYDET